MKEIHERLRVIMKSSLIGLLALFIMVIINQIYPNFINEFILGWITSAVVYEAKIYFSKSTS